MFFLFVNVTGDLFIDGKVVHRPQFRFDERQQTRSRPRPRYDRRRETMQVERRETMYRGGPGSRQMPQNAPHGDQTVVPRDGN